MFQRLSELKELITDSETVPEDVKLEAAVDIETLKAQLTKHDPDREVVARLWPRVAKAADVAPGFRS